MTPRRVAVATLAACGALALALAGCATDADDVAGSAGDQSQQLEATQAEESVADETREGEEEMARTITASTANGELAIDLTDNSSADALLEMLADGPVTVEMEDYANMEKVGSLGRDLPTNDKSISTTAGDVILYQGDKLVIYYSTNSWSFTKLGRVQEQDIPRIREVLGSGDATVTLTVG